MIIKINKSVWFNAKNLPVVFLFITLFFQATVLKNIWSFETVSRIVNFAALLFLNLYFIVGFSRLRFSVKVWTFYFIPGLLVYLGMMLNIAINVYADSSNISFWGLTLPWCAYLSVPMFMKSNYYFDEKLWKYYFNFLIISTLLALIEFFLVFGISGTVPLSLVETNGGLFKAGYFGIFYPVLDGVHFRFYSIFLEPGTLAMFLIPAIAYAYFYKNFIALVIMVVAVGFTLSLGAFVSLITLPFFIYLIALRSVISIQTLAIIVIVAIASTQIGYFQDAYANKGGSRETRTDNIKKGIQAIPEMVIVVPLGAEFSDSEQRGEYISAASFTTFMPLQKFVFGGVFSFVGYLGVVTLSVLVTTISLFRKDLLTYEKVVFASMLPLASFLIQRTTVWESALFALLFAPSIIRYLDGKSQKRSLVKKEQESLHH